jgi:hypothetical protein
MYIMSRAKSLDTLWEEWHVGLVNQPSIQELLANGTWLKSLNVGQRQYFYRRKRIIQRIYAYANAKNITAETAMAQALARQQQQNTTLDAMSKSAGFDFMFG